MPRDGSGIYTRPPGTNAVADTTIESTKYNANVADVETDLNAPRPIIAGGTGANNAVDAANNLGVVTGKGAQTFTEAEKAVARSNIAAAPFDALAYNGMQINGSMDVSQEKGAAGLVLSTPGANGGYIVDGWTCYHSNAATRVVIAKQATLVGLLNGFSNGLLLNASTGGSYAAIGDMLLANSGIEGFRTARLFWGYAGAQPITVGFWCFSTIGGTLAFSAQNGAINRSYVVDVPVIAGWQYKTVTIPGDTTGTWAVDNTVGIKLGFCVTGSGGSRATPNTWSAGNLICTANTTNLMATNGNNVYLTGVIVLPGTQAPTAAQSALIMRPYDQELVTCQRYFYNGAGDLAGHAITTNLVGASHAFKRTMRTTPTITATYIAAVGSPGAFGLGQASPNDFAHYNTANNWTVTAMVFFQTLLADARL